MDAAAIVLRLLWFFVYISAKFQNDRKDVRLDMLIAACQPVTVEKRVMYECECLSFFTR